MIQNENSEVFVYVCQNCMPDGTDLPGQWTQGSVHVQVKRLPCTGKTSLRYIFHALESGCRGICVVGCPPGDCHLAQGNYRAQMRINTVRRLLVEAGMEPERVQFIHYSHDDAPDGFENLIRAIVQGFVVLGESPLFTGKEKVLVN